MNKKIIIDGIELDKGDLELSDFDVAEFLDSDEIIDLYLAESVKTGNQQEIAQALKDIARAKGMTQLAKDTGLARENLYRALSGNNEPKLSTLQKISNALGFELSLTLTPLHSKKTPKHA